MKSLIRTLTAFSVASALTFAWAEEEAETVADDAAEETTEASSEETTEESSDESAEASSDESAEGEEESAEGEEEGRTVKKNEKYFHLLPYCRLVEGKAEVRRLGSEKWEPIQEGKFYPLGTAYRTIGQWTRLVIKFGREVDVEIKGEASFATRAQGVTETTRTITPTSGKVMVKLPRNFPDNLFVVTGHGFKTKNPKGNSSYETIAAPGGDGDTVLVRCITGDLSLEGRHFEVVSMKAANEIKIRTTHDQLFTGLYGSRGDYIVRLDQGRHFVKDFSTGETNEEEKKLDWTLSPKTAVRIHRAMPALGEKMSVTIMTFDASGKLKNRCAFSENTAQVNTGELGPTAKKDREALAKQAAEATESGAAAEAADVTETAAAPVDNEEAPTSDTASESSSSDDDELDF